MTPGTLRIDIADHELTVSVVGGGIYVLPVGPLTLQAGPLRDGDPPAPAALTNALGLIEDHLDDLVIELPSIEATPGVVVAGPYAEAMAHVELGTADIPSDYELQRADADEVFRTLAVEPVDERRHNPGLPADHVESIIATCCVILGIMRRFDLSAAAIAERANSHDADETTR
jgi:exopolyphosphatase/guanosine-5'-triphosphate,3'-diphosphate pyrophosphatase